MMRKESPPSSLRGIDLPYPGTAAKPLDGRRDAVLEAHGGPEPEDPLGVPREREVALDLAAPGRQELDRDLGPGGLQHQPCELRDGRLPFRGKVDDAGGRRR